MDVLHRLESHGVLVVNSPRAIECAVDKYLALSRAVEKGLPVPHTVICERATQALDHFHKINDRNPGRGVVVKPLFGAEGRGLRRLCDVREARAVFEDLEIASSVYYLQEFIPHPGWDLRALVIGGRVVSCMRRRALQDDEWRTNIALGGVGEAIDPDAFLTELALAASDAVATQIAGVDLIPDDSGDLQIVEVNAAPGWRELASVSATDIAGEILSYMRATSGGHHRPKNEPRKTSSLVRPKI
jgi:ribosomal protein S6--L-glutamate ligase